MQTNTPIGIFDSGIGGLTVTRAIRRLLPQEDIIYFGDTAHMPYGDKSTEAIQAYSIKIVNFLLSQQCKAIVIACNSASSAAYKLIREYVGNRALVVNVIDPMVEHVAEHYAGKKIGLIGTKQTVRSNVYKKKIDDMRQGIQLQAMATPLLAPMIEEGYAGHPIMAQVIRDYLNKAAFDDIQALILGCTHYPLIKDMVDDYFGGKVDILDSSEIVAQAVESKLCRFELKREDNRQGNAQFFVSDYTPAFEEMTGLFFGEHAKLTLYPLWE
ncbi:glutamate racemase [Thermonema rossianum]|uniref:glutamate racemase n=1 Tax=Thermonema rossianum TaxID=55505 RepID=UPI00056FBC23|nr:glutamate racemase [Thermonema rossianum]